MSSCLMGTTMILLQVLDLCVICHYCKLHSFLTCAIFKVKNTILRQTLKYCFMETLEVIYYPIGTNNGSKSKLSCPALVCLISIHTYMNSLIFKV